MPEYIERDMALKALCQVSAPIPSESNIVEKCIEKVNGVPAAEVALVVRARWEICIEPNTFDTFGNPDKYARCTHCGFRWGDLYSVKNYFKRCPGCGAMMDGDGNV